MEETLLRSGTLQGLLELLITLDCSEVLRCSSNNNDVVDVLVIPVARPKSVEGTPFVYALRSINVTLVLFRRVSMIDFSM